MSTTPYGRSYPIHNFHKIWGFLTKHVDNILEHFVKEVNENVAKEETADG